MGTKKNVPQSGGKGYKNIALIAGLVIVVAMGAVFVKGSKQDSIVDRDKISKELPEYAYVSQVSVQAYTVAVNNPGLLEKMPCYCGCVNMDHGDGNVLQHNNNRDCFIKSDGSFEEHAAYCDLCQYIALDAYDMYSKGTPLKDIRSAIDSKYGNGRYGPGTNTPPVV